jgi:hypothetical protein
LEFDWKERGGPPARRARKPGFGSRLIGMVIERQLNGAMHRTFGPDGLDARLIIPLTHERWPRQVVMPAEEGQPTRFGDDP